MLHLDVSPYEEAFQTNLKDWSMGGPKAGGYSRLGPPIDIKGSFCLSYARRCSISVEDGLAKNKKQVLDWHVAYLCHPTWDALYIQEYLLSRFDEIEAANRASRFLALHVSIRTNGFRDQFPVYVADVSALDLGFRYFRFDGCHRLASAYVLGLAAVPAYLFKLKEYPAHV